MESQNRKRRKGLVTAAWVVLGCAWLLPVALPAAGAERYVAQVKLPSGQTVVVAEGDLEARSVGSFSVRLYDTAAAGEATTFFLAGLVLARDGTVENVLLADVDGDRKPEILVTVRSVGTGGYLSAHAFAVDDSQLTLLSSVEGLAPQTDPVAALRTLLEIKK